MLQANLVGRRDQGMVRARLCMLVMLMLLGGCSSVPKAVNPVHWYDSVVGSGSEAKTAEDAGSQPFPSLSSVPERPAPTPIDERTDVMEGLVADRENARHAGEAARREPPPRAAEAAPAPPPAPGPAPSAIPAPAPAPESAPSAISAPRPRVQPAPASPPPAPRPEAAPQAPPAATPPAPRAEAAPPPAAAAPALRPPAAAASTVDESYRRRLAESASATAEVSPVLPNLAAVAPRAAPLPAPGADPLTASPGATALITFPIGSALLGSDEISLLGEVAALQKRRGASVRVLVHPEAKAGPAVDAMLGALELAGKQGDAVGRELRRLGVPSQRLTVTALAADGAGPGAPGRAEIHLAE